MEQDIKKTSRTLQAEQTKKMLLEVAVKLMGKHGYDNVKIEDICKESNVSVGAFYHHMKNKAGIIVELYRQCDEYFENLIEKEFSDPKNIQAVSRYIKCQTQYAESMPVDLGVQVYRAQLTEGTEFFLSPDRSLTNGLVQIISKLQKVNVISEIKSAFEIANEILTISRGCLYNWYQKEGKYNLTEYAETLITNYIMVYKI